MKTYIVDAFTDKPYAGNPAGVCILDKALPDELLIKIAREVHHSETAFLLKKDDTYSLRWFTPKAEVALCGHATLATAHILHQTKVLQENEVVSFDTKSGVLTAKVSNSLIELNFPQIFVDECESNEILEQAFDIKPLYVGKNDKRYLIVIDSIDTLKVLTPDFNLLKKSDLGAFMLTVQSSDEFDFYARFFAPGVGINEDPVTGSAYCYLAPYWSKVLRKNKMLAYQGERWFC